MNYILNKRYRFRGWKNRLGGVYDTEKKKVFFLDRDSFLFLMKCDGAHDIDVESLTENQKN